MTTLASGLHQVPFLQPLTNDQIAQVVALGTRLIVPAGGVLFRKGDIGHCMYVILAGKVQADRPVLVVSGGNVSSQTASAILARR